jgi:hypothetical protein
VRRRVRPWRIRAAADLRLILVSDTFNTVRMGDLP